MKKILLLALALACGACVREVVLEPDGRPGDGDALPDGHVDDGVPPDGGTDGIPPDAAPSD